MSFDNSVYITSLGKFLPGSPVSNDEVENYLGLIGGKPSLLKSRILKQNGIRSRHYALEPGGGARTWNYELAANAVKDALSNSELSSKDVEFVAAATSQSDLLAPGFASQVHGASGLPACEIASFQSVCAGGMMPPRTRTSKAQPKSPPELKMPVSAADQTPSKPLQKRGN